MFYRISLILFLAGILMQLNSCFLPKNLAHFDIEFENRKKNVDSYTKDFGFKKHDKVIAYKLTDGLTVEASPGPENLNIESACIENDSLYLVIKSGNFAESEKVKKIPVSRIQSIRVRRFYFGPTAAIAGVGIMMFLSFLGL